MWVPGDYVLYTNGVNYIQKYDGTTCATLAGLPSAGQTTATAIEIFENYVLLLGITEGGTAYPQRVKRCDTGDPTNWSTGNAGYDDLMDTEDFILTSEPLGIYIMIYRERSIMRCGYIGTSVQLFQFDYMITGEGPCSSLAVANVGDYHIFFGDSNIYRYEGGVSLDPVGDKVFYKLFGSGGILNTPYKNRVFGLYVEELDEVWFMLPHASNTVPSLLVRWQLGVEAWSFREFYHDLLGYGFYQLTASRTWNDLVGSWDSQSWKWDERRILSGAPTTLLCGHNPKQYQADRDSEQAINEYKSALQYDAESPYLVVQIATLYLMQNNPDEAIKWCNKAIAIDARYLEAHLLLAGIYASQNNNPEAIKQYEAILAIDPLQQDAYLYLGSLYSESNEPQKAIDTLQRLLKINPESSMAHFYLGNVYMGLKNYAEAEKHYTRALDINPDFESALINLGVVNETQNKLPTAIGIYKNILELRPQNHQVRSRLTYLLIMDKQLDAALTQLLILRKQLGDKQGEIGIKIGLIYSEQKKWPLAKKEFLQIVEQDPQNYKAWYHLGTVYEELDQMPASAGCLPESCA